MIKPVSLLLVAIGLFILVSANANAQQQPRTTVQLPVFSFFGAGTTVNVPDRGQVLLGSVKRSSTGSVSRGVPLLGNLPVLGRPFKNRAIGKSNSASTLSATVQIYDLHEMDKALLEKARRDRVLKLGGPAKVKELAEKDAIKRKADFITRNLGRSSTTRR